MTFANALTQLRDTYRNEVNTALTEARRRLETARSDLAAAEREVSLFEGILTGVAGSASTSSDGGLVKPVGERQGGYMTLHEAMHKVLRESPERRLRAGDIIAQIERQGLYRMRDGRVPESQQIHARANNYPHLFNKDGPYFLAR